MTVSPKYSTVEPVLIMEKSSIEGGRYTEGTPAPELGKSFANGPCGIVGRIVFVLTLLFQLRLESGRVVAAA